jgi:hypothetical protein
MLIVLFNSGVAQAEEAKTPQAYPEFSWDTVPVYAHCSYDPEFFKPEHYDFLAKHFKLVAFTAGMKEKIETGIAAGAAEVKKRNPNVKVLFYFAGDILHSNFTISNASYPENGFLEKDAVRRSVNKKTGKVTLRTRKYFDKSREDVREWWASVAEKAVKEYGCDGIFADGLGSDGRGLLSPQRQSEVRDGIKTMCDLAHEKMGPNGLIIFNPLHGSEGADLLPATDGAMIDNFDRVMYLKDREKKPNSRQLDAMTEAIEAMSKASKQGKIVIFKGWPGFHQKDVDLMKRPHEERVKLAQAYINFPLASFLVGAGPNCYFQYTWGWRPEFGTFDWYPEFDKPLGPPKGEAVKNGYVYTREFEHASVYVDLENKKGRIDWR